MQQSCKENEHNQSNIKLVLTGSKDKRGREPLKQFPVIFNSASV